MNILIDAGACKGDFTDSWLRKNSKGKVVCVEPDPKNAQSLRERFAGKNVTVIEKAVWIEQGVQNFWPGTTSENGSITIRNETQIGLLEEETQSLSVECVKITDLVSQYASDENSFLTLKIDIEGVEFRCLWELVQSDVFPDVLYLEDGCRKCLDINEWLARINFFKAVVHKNLASSIFVEGNTKGRDEYIETYEPLGSHAPFKIIKNGQVNVPLHDLRVFIENMFKNNPGLYEQAKRFDFLFTWLTCHEVRILLKSGQVFVHNSEHPINSTKDFDIVTRLIKTVTYTLDEPGNASIEFEFQSLEDHQKIIEDFVDQNHKTGLL